MILIWRFGDRVKIAKLTYAIIDPFILMGFYTYSTQNHQFKIPPTAFLNKPPNIMFAYYSAYTVVPIYIYIYIYTYIYIYIHTPIVPIVQYSKGVNCAICHTLTTKGHRRLCIIAQPFGLCDNIWPFYKGHIIMQRS